MFVQMPDGMIQVGIVGSSAAIRRHTQAMHKIQDIRITGRWIAGSEAGPVSDADTGKPCSSAGELIGTADALVIDGCGDYCSDLAIAALRAARHVFLHSSSVRSVNEAYQLLKLAREAGVILRAGKTGNYNTRGLLEALGDKADINMIELQHYYRIATGHSHMPQALLADLEVITSLLKARVISIKAKGICMIASQPDILNARLEFDNGCAVNYNCNLVAAQSEFLGTFVLKNRILKYNFITGEVTSWFLQQPDGGEDPLFIQRHRVENTDTLTGELTDFFGLIRADHAFLSMYDSGFEPYVLAERILEKVMKTLVRCS